MDGKDAVGVPGGDFLNLHELNSRVLAVAVGWTAVEYMEDGELSRENKCERRKKGMQFFGRHQNVERSTLPRSHASHPEPPPAGGATTAPTAGKKKGVGDILDNGEIPESAFSVTKRVI